MKISPIVLALLVVAADCVGLLIIGLLVLLDKCPIGYAVPVITGILASGRIPKAIKMLQGRDEDDDDPPAAPRSRKKLILVTGGVLSLFAGLWTWRDLVRVHKA